ncbi:hypothetical protein ACFL0Y_01410 [Patescibacteria group bacterium]
MKKVIFLGVAVLLLAFSVNPALAFLYSGKDYGDVALNDWGTGHFPDKWDLTQCDLTLSYSIDMSGQTTGGWTPIEVGLKEEGAPDLDPNGQGGWMFQNWQNTASNPTSANLNDHFVLVNHGWASDELNYDVDGTGNIVSPFGSYNSYAFWFDRDGVDTWQAAYWNYKDGITYNTGGVYDVEIVYSAENATTGKMMAKINGEEQGFYLLGYDSANPPDEQPVGKSFLVADTSQLQVFYGRGSGGGTVDISDITVSGCTHGLKVSGGGQIIEEKGSKPKDNHKISFGGNVWDVGSAGYMGNWEINFHNVGVDEFDKSKFHSTDIRVINLYEGNTETCNEAMNMTMYGEWNGQPGYKVILRAGDFGPPGHFNEVSFDTVRIELYEPGVGKVYDTHSGGEFSDESSCVGTARTGLDHGNLTIEF